MAGLAARSDLCAPGVFVDPDGRKGISSVTVMVDVTGGIDVDIAEAQVVIIDGAVGRTSGSGSPQS